MDPGAQVQSGGRRWPEAERDVTGKSRNMERVHVFHVWTGERLEVGGWRQRWCCCCITHQRQKLR